MASKASRSIVIRVATAAVAFASIMLVSGCVTPKLLPDGKKNAFDDRKIRLEVFQDRTGEKLRFVNNDGCTTGPTGCVKIRKNRSGSIIFALEFAKGVSTGWKLYRMEMRDAQGNWPGDSGYSLDPDVVEDFNMGTCTDGVVCKAHIPASGRRMFVEDSNNHEFDVHYRIWVKNSADEKLVAHPIIENRGTHTN